jgi:hypothetical protein
MKLRRHNVAALLLIGSVVGVQAQQPAHTMPMEATLLPSMERMGSGTTWIPDAVALPSATGQIGSWSLMGHGMVFAQYDRQSGPRGDDQFGLLNWGMLMASHPLAGGRLQLRTMLSLDAATDQDGGYPLLLQTGETYQGDRLHDRQHPHDFWMELGALYERPMSSDVGVSLYAAPSGEPALGPVAFMHRPSAVDDPMAPLGHHWQDATHITFGVVTAGLFGRTWKAEASAFNGREPDEERWDFDRMRLDSWSGRVTLNPTHQLSLTVGYGLLNEPEPSHPGDMQRVTASVMYGKRVGDDGQFATTAVWGANRHDGGSVTHSGLLEAQLIMNRNYTMFGRGEVVQKSGEELVLDDALHDELYNVASLSLGLIRELFTTSGVTAGLGLRGTVNVVPSGLRDEYGSRTPTGVVAFLRLRPTLKPPMMPGMMHMNH